LAAASVPAQEPESDYDVDALLSTYSRRGYLRGVLASFEIKRESRPNVLKGDELLSVGQMRLGKGDDAPIQTIHARIGAARELYWFVGKPLAIEFEGSVATVAKFGLPDPEAPVGSCALYDASGTRGSRSFVADIFLISERYRRQDKPYVLRVHGPEGVREFDAGAVAIYDCAVGYLMSGRPALIHVRTPPTGSPRYADLEIWKIEPAP
jgi:hypothetical protein